MFSVAETTAEVTVETEVPRLLSVSVSHGEVQIDRTYLRPRLLPITGEVGTDEAAITVNRIEYVEHYCCMTIEEVPKI